MPLQVRAAGPGDAPAMATLINAIIAIGGTTAHRTPFDAEGIVAKFIAPPLLISCFVACDGAEILGFQSLDWSDPDWPGEDAMPADWGIIGSFVDPAAQGRGVGRALFAATREAARRAGVSTIDATIRRENTGGLAFYDGLGFTDYRSDELSISKRLTP